MLEEIEQDIEQFKKMIDSKNKQMVDLKNILKSGKKSYQEVTKENKELKQYLTNIKQQQYQQQQQQIYQQHKIYSRLKKYQKVAYEEPSDSETKQKQQETPTFEEIEEQDNSLQQQQQQQQSRKEN